MCVGSALSLFSRFFVCFYLFVVFFVYLPLNMRIILMVSKFFVLLIFNGDTNHV